MRRVLIILDELCEPTPEFPYDDGGAAVFLASSADNRVNSHPALPCAPQLTRARRTTFSGPASGNPAFKPA
jgi:hypothetical protein